MKQFWEKNKFVLIAFAFWVVVLQLVEKFSYIVPLRTGFLGVSPWGNFDGMHYVHLADSGYFLYSQAFFPLYPLCIRLFHQVTGLSYEVCGMTISLVSFLAGLLLLYRLLAKKSEQHAKFAIVFLLTFPTSFFFHAIYTEGLFFLCVVLVMYFTQKKKFLSAGVVVGLAGALRIVGVCLALYVLIEYIRTKPKKIRVSDCIGFILMPAGLLAYMYFLARTKNDPFLFMHVQEAFGANRSSSTLIVLPQVVWRYMKIIFTAYMQPTAISYIVTIAECIMTGGAYILLWFGRKRISLAAALYCLVVLTIPTLTGTFSSMPRYILSAVPLFIIAATIPTKPVRIVLLLLSGLFEIMATVLFLRGWFIA